MRRKVVFAETAMRDIAAIYDFLSSRFGETAAEASVDRLYDHCLRFELFPKRGQRRDDLAPGLRVVGYHRLATIAFLVDEDAVVIARIFASGRRIDGDDFR